MKKSKLYMIIAIVVLILSTVGSYAWYKWASTTNTNVSIGTCIPEITFIGGATLSGDDLYPTKDKTKGATKKIEVFLNETCKEEDSGIMNLYMTLDSLPEELQEESFVYEIWKDGIRLNSGNFAEDSEEDTITLLSNQVITETSSAYMVYVYIDGNYENPIEMSSQAFRFSIFGEGTGAIYKENTIANFTPPTNSSSPFLNSGIARSDIESITIVEDNTVPEGLEGISLSSIQGDDSVMLWYTDEDENDLFEVYIGSKNGIVKLNTSASSMFAYLTNIEYLDLTNVDTSDVTNMASMFYKSSSLKEIKLSNFDTSNVTSMGRMFDNCSSLETLDLSSFVTSNVTSMVNMFYGCNSLTSLDLNSFVTTNVTTTAYMFYNCNSITSINLSNADFSEIAAYSNMFINNSNLTVTVDSIQVNWITSNFNQINVVEAQ